MKPGLLLFLFAVCLVVNPLESQAQQYSLKTQDSLIHILVNRHIAINEAKSTMPGYRVQVYFGPNRAKAIEVKTDFLQLFPNTGAYLVYQQPNFKIRVGDYKTRLEALQFLKEIQTLYSAAFIVKDEVKLPE
jgi:SPOR domain